MLGCQLRKLDILKESLRLLGYILLKVISFNNFIYVYDETRRFALGLDWHFYGFVPPQCDLLK